MALPMTTQQVLQTGTGKSVSIGGVIGIVTLVAESLKDGVIEPTEIGAIATAICAVFGVIRLRRAIGTRPLIVLLAAALGCGMLGCSSAPATARPAIAGQALTTAAAKQLVHYSVLVPRAGRYLVVGSTPDLGVWRVAGPFQVAAAAELSFALPMRLREYWVERISD
ncbi:MAG: hypothetical protein IT377_12185 [Polyangiaceae bacterium]|nr:hypothetical protein [Polyangiaceae bacterium]